MSGNKKIIIISIMRIIHAKLIVNQNIEEISKFEIRNG